jgi:hypothetical protein
METGIPQGTPLAVVPYVRTSHWDTSHSDATVIWKLSCSLMSHVLWRKMYTYKIKHSFVIWKQETFFVEPYKDVLAFFTTDDGQHVGRNTFGLWSMKVFKSSWLLLYFSTVL